VSREDIFLVESFSGGGGMHLGYADQGLTTRCAVEINKVAAKTFKKNNPDVPVYRGDVNDFIKEYDGSKIGRVDVIHTSSPCQGFSKDNRDGGQNDEKCNELSYAFVDLLRITGALVGVFENVTGMWDEDNIRYLRKLLIDTIALGYQVRVQKLRGT
jgi:DNA (cytosine-5)-methyltransferase 1